MIQLIQHPIVLENIDQCIWQIKKHWPTDIAKWELKFLQNAKKQTEDNIELADCQQLKLAEIMDKLFRK